MLKINLYIQSFLSFVPFDVYNLLSFMKSILTFMVMNPINQFQIQRNEASVAGPTWSPLMHCLFTFVFDIW